MPLITPLYFLGNKISGKAGKLILALGSIGFYAYAGPDSLLVFLLSIVVNYIFVLLMKRGDRFRRLFMLVPVIINVFLLLLFSFRN